MKLSLIGLLLATGLSSNTTVPTLLNAKREEDPSIVVGSGSQVLRVMNSADYIYIDEDNPDNNLWKQFEVYAKELGFTNCEVVYETSDTNESLYSQMTTGKADYDLVNFSDYIIQKCINNDLVVPFMSEDETINQYALYRNNFALFSNYDTYASKYIRNRLDQIDAVTIDGQSTKVGNYAVGYMWGTLGLLCNPTYNDAYLNPGSNSDQSVSSTTYENLKEWSILKNPSYKGTISIKDSMRDTYCIGVLEAYKDQFLELKDQLADGTLNEEEYNTRFADLFNSCDEESVTKAGEELDKIKENIFGLEVDQGKQDICKGYIGMDTAWSGDAVYAMELAYEENIELVYSVPEVGSNLWFDNWVVPKTNRSEAQTQLLYLFLDYISNPEVAAMNVDYTGYTSFIGGEEIRDLMRDWYDTRCDDVYYYDEEEDEYYDIYRIDSSSSSYEIIGFDDCLSSRSSSFDAEELVYFIPYELNEEEVTEPSDYDDLIDHGDYVYLEDEETVKTYADLVKADEEYCAVDLNYFFNEDYSDDAGFIRDEEYVFYNDGYFVEDNNNCVGNDFFTQFPDYDCIKRCAVMRDFGENNDFVLQMWEKFKSNALPIWAIILFVVEITLVVGFAAFWIVSKKIKVSLRRKRIEDAENNSEKLASNKK